METPQYPDNNEQKPPLSKRNSDRAHIERGLNELENHANDPVSHMSPEERAEIEGLNNLYSMPAMEPGHRNTQGLAGKIDPKPEVDPLDPHVPYTELGSVASNPTPDFNHVREHLHRD